MSGHLGEGTGSAPPQALAQLLAARVPRHEATGAKPTFMASCHLRTCRDGGRLYPYSPIQICVGVRAQGAGLWSGVRVGRVPSQGCRRRAE